MVSAATFERATESEPVDHWARAGVVETAARASEQAMGVMRFKAVFW